MEECFTALSRQTMQDFEIILVDNGSTDGSMEQVERQWTHLRLMFKYLGRNCGFTVANNIGASLARGKWIVLLNTDAFPEPNWLENLIRAAEHNPGYGAFSSRQLQFHTPHLLDGAGDVYHISGLAWRRCYNLPAQTNGLEQGEIFSPCAAAAMYSREEFLKAGGFDEDYFSYFEDVDLGFRLLLNGVKSMYVPDAVVHHVGSASTGKRSDFSVYYGYRNLIWTFIKNMPSPYFWIFLPLHISVIFFFAFYLTLRRQPRAIWSAIFDAIRGMPSALKKRKIIQQNRQASPSEVLRMMSVSLLEPFTEFMRRNQNK